MNKNIRKFLKISFSIMLVIYVAVFVFLTLFMSSKTKESISEINETYMSEMNLQLRQKFTSIMDLRLEQVDGIIKRDPPNAAVYDDDMKNALATSADIRGFSYLGLYAGSDRIERLLGDEITIRNVESLETSLKADGSIIAEGTNTAGEKMLVLGKEAAYPMANGEQSIALFAAVPMEYLNDALFLYEDESLIYTHIIDLDGTFIIRNGDAYRNSYFERVAGEYDEINGKDPEYLLQEMKDAMANREDYYSMVTSKGIEDKQLYCSPISEYSDWYLVSVMSNNALEQPIVKLDGIRLVIMFASSAILIAGMLIIFIIFFRLSRQQLDALREAKKAADVANKAKSEFLSSMSHDIRTPMNAIIGMTEIAIKNMHDPTRVEDCLKKVKLSGKHLLGLINDVLDMSKIESGKMVLNVSPMSLREAMDDIVNIIQPQVKAKDQKFDIFIHDIISEEVNCDPVRLNQVLLNLLSNAVKYTQDGGRIDVHLYQEPSELGDGYIRNHFIVEDNGIGMSKEFQKKIFDTFEREDDKVNNIAGTGLGMSITKHIVEMMEGTIDLESEQGVGSKFHVTVDLEKAFVDESEMKLPAWNVLIVDDNELLCTSAAANLEELGVTAEWTMDGREAIQMIHDHHDKNNDYQFVLVDWKMPNMDGLETIRQIHQSVGNSVPIFLISAYDWNDLDDEIQMSDIEGFISKPLFKSTLYARLSQYTDDHHDVASQHENQEVDFEGKHVLLAEDIDLNWEIANEIFSSIGLILDHAVNGLDCIEQFKQSPVGFYDAILMDVRMPVMNGYDATKVIRSLERADKNLPIIAMTADAFADDARQCMDCGMNAHLPKPLDIQECIRVFQKYIK